uniref:T6SS Phospholipase effector Tle1-like catalytic domain-containing protein n=2 Tax=Moniliophthora roreri TaxID=221103 RepID=A0A0W0G0D7_MONRR
MPNVSSDSIDVEDVAEVSRFPSLKPKWPRRKYCNCIHGAIHDGSGRITIRNLVVCIDGTANQFSNKNTNVVELYSRLEKSETLQATFYNSGIGTYATPSWRSWNYYKQVIDHKIDLAIAWNFQKILLTAYEWVCEQYRPGDRIFLFGFSRGAYQVRALSGMIEKVGLIHKGNEAQIPFAFNLYRKCSSAPWGAQPLEPNSGPTGMPSTNADAAPNQLPSSPQSLDTNQPTASPQRPESSNAAVQQQSPIEQQSSTPSQQQPLPSADNPATSRPASDASAPAHSPDDDAALFKRTFCRADVKVHFVGAWDTVSSVGIVRRKELPLTTHGMKHVCFFRHALALDERRVKFLPEFAYGGVGPTPEDTESTRSEMPHTKEVWFVGTHSDIGGGNIENKNLNNNGPALRWMTREAALLGLLLTPSSTRWSQSTKNVNESLTRLWWFLEVLPIKRLTYKDTGGRQTARWPHLGKRRNVTQGQLVHGSVIWEAESQPADRQEIFKPWLGPSNHHMIEPDNFDQVTAQILSSITLLGYIDNTEEREKHLFSLRKLFGTFEAQQALVNLSQDLCEIEERDATEEDTLATMDVLIHTAAGLFERQHFSRMPIVVRKLLCAEGPRKDRYIRCATEFLKHFGTSEIFSIRRKGPITAFAFCSNSERIACGTVSGHVFVREVTTGAEVKMKADDHCRTRTEHSDRVTCITFTPDNKKIVSGSSDQTIRIWDATTGEHIWVYDVKGHPLSFAFSEDGTNLFSVSTVSIGGPKIQLHPLVEAGGEPPNKTPKAITIPDSNASSVAFSRIVTPKVTPTVLSALASTVASTITSTITSAVATEVAQLARKYCQDLPWGSPVQNHHFSTSVDEQEPLPTDQDTSFTSKIEYLTHRIVSGSSDKIIRIWNPSSAKLEAVYQRTKGTTPRHRDEIRSVVFSNDGSMIFAGSLDGAISVWDATSGNVRAMWAATTGDDVKEFAGWLGAQRRRVSVNALAVAPSGTRIVAGLQDGKVYVWELENDKPRSVIEQPFCYSNSAIVSVAYSPDGKRIAACNEDGLVIVWDVGGPAGECILEQLKKNDRWFP